MQERVQGRIVYLRKDNMDEVIFVTDDGQEFTIQDVYSFSYRAKPLCVPTATIVCCCLRNQEISTGY